MNHHEPMMTRADMIRSEERRMDADGSMNAKVVKVLRKRQYQVNGIHGPLASFQAINDHYAIEIASELCGLEIKFEVFEVRNIYRPVHPRNLEGWQDTADKALNV